MSTTINQDDSRIESGKATNTTGKIEEISPGKQFPAYFGFGKLLPQSLSDGPEEITANYYYQSRAVHKLTYDKVRASWEMRDIFSDQGTISACRRLNQLALYHFCGFDSITNDIFQFVISDICSCGNIYFEHLASPDKGATASYHPAGRLLIFRLPVFFDKEGQKKLPLLMEELPKIIGDATLKLADYYNTTVFSTDHEGNKEPRPVVMFEYIVPLAYVKDVVNWMVQNQLIDKRKKLRLMIQDSIQKVGHSIQTFQGTPEDDYRDYTIFLKGYDETKIKFEDLEHRALLAFRDEYLSRMQKDT